MNLDPDTYYDYGYFMEHGSFPPPKKRPEKHTPSQDNFDLLNYLEVNFETCMGNGYKFVKGYR